MLGRQGSGQDRSLRLLSCGLPSWEPHALKMEAKCQWNANLVAAHLSCVQRGSKWEEARNTGVVMEFAVVRRHYHDPEDGTACAKVPCDCTHICLPSWHQMWMASLQATLAKVGRKGSPRYQEWGQPLDYAIPGINVPLKYVPWEHNITAMGSDAGQSTRQAPSLQPPLCTLTKSC